MGCSKKLLKVLLAVVALLLLLCGGSVWLGSWALHQVRHSLVSVSHADPNLQKAVKEARDTLPKFEGRLKHPEPGDRFAIKAEFQTPYGPEYLWLKDPSLTASSFEAVLDQVPVAVPKLRKGDRIKVSEKAVVDWLIRRADGSMAGGFTDLALGRGPG
jgi:uncharacterized protein YegJ (DUF2314 family)